MFDIIVLGFLLIAFLWGWARGFLAQLFSLVGALCGFLMACFLYGNLGDFLAPKMGTTPTMGHIIAFFLIWIVVPVLCTYVTRVLEKFLKLIKLGWINCLLGSAFSIFKFMLFMSIVLTLIEFIDKYKSDPIVEQATKEESKLYYLVQEFAGKLLPSDFLEIYTTNPEKQ